MESRQERLKEILAEAVARSDPAARVAYLDEACAGDEPLRAKVEALAKAYDEKGDFVEKTLPVSERELIGEGPGTVIGRYKLLQQIGEGGFGVVFMAEQVEPVQRKVALKIIKPGMDTKEVIARFEAERQALALMDHPNIAQVLDGGATESGRPYFVMELVKGIKITDYCDQNHLSTEERLNLFITVCHAVQHAHQKGVIHRDLKPSNVMITLHDGEAVPKVIDFGIAKATGQRLTEKTLFTRYEQMIGTPAYMSPEQAAISGLDVDTRTDIYALGVLLYELLTGVTPFDKETLAKVALDEIRRMIRETEPPKPSTRLQQLAKTQRLAVSGQWSVVSSQRWKDLRGDLDWIVMKALEKDRRRRYETANAFAEDIQRHLDHQPVQASPPSTAYRVRKFARRHRVGVAMGAAVTLALVAGLSLALVGFKRARQERDRALAAEAETRRERDRAVQAEIDQRAILATFASEMAADNEMFALLKKGAEAARDRLGPTNETTLNFIRATARRCGRLGAWTNTLELYRTLLAAEPDDHSHWYFAHAAALSTRQMDRCRELCTGMLARFAGSQDPVVCQRVALSLSFSTDRPSDLEIALKLADRGVKGGLDWSWSRATKAAVEYRLGDYDRAGELMKEFLNDGDPTLSCLAAYFYAMVRQQQGETADARLLLEDANRRFAEVLGTGYLADGWHDHCRNMIARAEAERLILGREISPPVTAEFLAAARQEREPVIKWLREGESFALEKKWKESAEAYGQALQDPALHWREAQRASAHRSLAPQIGIAFVKAGDRSNYERLCRLLIALQRDPPKGLDAELCAKTCFLSGKSLPGELDQRALELARIAVLNPGKDRQLDSRWACYTCGVAEHCAGDLKRALELLLKAEASQDIGCKGGAMVYRAMVLKRLGRAAEAADVLQTARDLLAEPIKTRSGSGWGNLDICELALDEAQQLIGQPPKQ